MVEVTMRFFQLRNFVRNAVLLTLPTVLVAFLILELLFRFAVPASDPPQGFFDDEYLLYRLDARRNHGYYTYGALAHPRFFWRINKHGWNSPIEYSETKSRTRIAVIGDSFIQSLQVDVDKNYPSLLRNALKKSSDVYSFGVLGAPFSQYLHMSRYVREVFDPDVFIFNIVHNDFYNSLYSRNPNQVQWLRLTTEMQEVQEIAPRPDFSFSQYSLKKRLLKSSALVRYLYLNLQARELVRTLFGTPAVYSANIDVNVLQDHKDQIKVATAYIIRRIVTENPGKRIVFVMDAPRNSIYEGSESRVRYLHTLMRELTDLNGVEFVDLSKPMRDAFETNHNRFNPQFDGHWNEYGHEFVFAQILPLFLVQNDSAN